MRTLLFVPADQARKVERALASDADLVILDIEDAVAPGAKDAARRAAAAVLAGARVRPIAVRINALASPYAEADLASILPGAPEAVVLPKCEGPATLAALDRAVEQAGTGGRVRLMPQVTETVRSLRDLAYECVSERLAALIFAAEDLAAELGIASRRRDGSFPAPIAAARAALLLAAAAARVPAIDTPFADHRDLDGLAREAAEASADGFAGKLCIHPAQLGPVAAAFAPAPERVAWARRVREAFASRPGEAVLSLDGRMIEAPHLLLAERVLAAAGD